jgi:hypothetical protein
MSRISETMARDHAACDERFSAAEAAVAEGDLARAAGALAAFAAALERHSARGGSSAFDRDDRLPTG